MVSDMQTFIDESSASDTSSAVFPEGPKAIAGQELGGEYFEKAGPVIEKQVARAGFRMAAWLDNIAEEFEARRRSEDIGAEL